MFFTFLKTAITLDALIKGFTLGSIFLDNFLPAVLRFKKTLDEYRNGTYHSDTNPKSSACF
jgi:hypothetical protein